MKQQYIELLQQAYKAFNARDIDAALSLMQENVLWPNGWEGGYLQGHKEVKSYWTRQWKELDPEVNPISFNDNHKGQICVEVQQNIRDLKRNILSESIVHHVYTFEMGKIKSMEIKS